MRATGHFGCGVALVLTAAVAMHAADVAVETSGQLRRAAQDAEAGARLVLEGSTYSGGVYLQNVCGREGRPIVIEGADANKPPVFTGGSQALHLADCAHVVLRNLRVEGFALNGINIDDGGSFETPARGIVLENVTIVRTGPKGNHDALKMSGVDHFVVRNCRFEGWGGSGIDMVGCHHGVVENCTFVGREGYSQSNAVQLKGGTRDVLVHKCLFLNAGERAINLGGSTGLAFFRPEVGDYEGKEITIAGNRFVGGTAAVAWVTADGGHVHHNTIFMPEKWVLRILQETKDEQFRRSHGGIFERNLVVYDSRVRVFVNIGPGTAPDTFVFRHNAWHAVDGERRPKLPMAEEGGLYLDDLNVSREALLRGEPPVRDPRLDDIGAHAYEPAGAR